MVLIQSKQLRYTTLLSRSIFDYVGYFKWCDCWFGDPCFASEQLMSIESVNDSDWESFLESIGGNALSQAASLKQSQRLVQVDPAEV